MNLVQLMKQVELFRGLNDQQLELLSRICREERYPRGKVIVEQGTAGDRMFIIGSGQVEVRVQISDGTSYAAVYLGRGQVFGEMALIDAAKRSATVLAADPETVVYSLPNDQFSALCESNTGIGYVMMRNMAQDLSFKLRHRDADPSQS